MSQNVIQRGQITLLNMKTGPPNYSGFLHVGDPVCRDIQRPLAALLQITLQLPIKTRCLRPGVLGDVF